MELKTPARFLLRVESQSQAKIEEVITAPRSLGYNQLLSDGFTRSPKLVLRAHGVERMIGDGDNHEVRDLPAGGDGRRYPAVR